MKKTTVVGTTKNYGATKMNAGKMNILEMDGGDRQTTLNVFNTTERYTSRWLRW